jgi:hypothetical protein
VSKYGPLRAYLLASGPVVDMHLADIAELVGGLPRSAYTYEAWWNNGDPTHSHCSSWGEAGYVAKVDLAARTVRFIRG